MYVGEGVNSTYRGDVVAEPLEDHIDVLHHAQQVEEAATGGKGRRGGGASLEAWLQGRAEAQHLLVLLVETLLALISQ